MAREFAITVYLAFFKILFCSFKKKPLEKKTTFVTSFGNNTKMTIKELERLVPDAEVVVLRAPGCRMNFTGKNRTVLDMQVRNLPQFIRSIYHLATSSHIFIDNYYGFLAASDFRDEVTCIQLWHAAGAIKQFGLQDLTNSDRSKRALRRFQKVYNRFDYVVVGSKQMEKVFKESFGLPEERFLYTGIPRTDFFFDNKLINKARQRLLDNFPIIKDKKMLLYAPTYRDGSLDTAELHMDLDKMYDQFKYEFVIFLRLHPAVDGKFNNKYPGFIYNVSNYPWINDLLVGSDVLITDYSSIPFEYSLLQKPMIFYAYDYDEYALKRGIWDDYTERVPGPVVYNTNQLIETICDENFMLDKVQSFSDDWNAYSKGDAAKQVIESLYETETVVEAENRTEPEDAEVEEDGAESDVEDAVADEVGVDAESEEDAPDENGTDAEVEETAPSEDGEVAEVEKTAPDKAGANAEVEQAGADNSSADTKVEETALNEARAETDSEDAAVDEARAGEAAEVEESGTDKTSADTDSDDVAVDEAETDDTTKFKSETETKSEIRDHA